jgi:hypothetical protein
MTDEMAEEPTFTPTITVSGSLKVYGASDDSPVYTENITKDNYVQIFGYFGIDPTGN